MKTALFGAAFDPPHLGHVDVLKQLIPTFSQIIIAPAAAHAFGKNMRPFQQRMDMVKLLLAEAGFGAPQILISDIEWQILAQKEKNPQAAPEAASRVTTYEVLIALAQQQAIRACFVIGPDNAKAATWQRFYQYKAIEAEFGLVKVQERKVIRSTHCQQVLRQFQQANAADKIALKHALTALVGQAVSNYLT